MSLYYDMVINCYLREDTPEEFIKAISFLTDPASELTASPKFVITEPDGKEHNFGNLVSPNNHFLAPNPEYQIISQFRKIHYSTRHNHEVYLWLLQYTGRWLHDDSFYEEELPFIYWLAFMSVDGLVGYWKETDHQKAKVHLIFAEGGKFREIEVDSFSSGNP
jgi:hypothetical protein